MLDFEIRKQVVLSMDMRWMNPDIKATIPSCVSAYYTPKFVRRIDDITGLLVAGQDYFVTPVTAILFNL